MCCSSFMAHYRNHLNLAFGSGADSISKPLFLRHLQTMKTRKILGVSLSLILINLAAIMERADENLLPSVYKEVSEAFNAGPSDLGYLTFIRNFVQGLSSPLAGVLVINYDRPAVLTIGILCWAFSTAAVGASQHFFHVGMWRAVNGFGLAIVIPALQSFIADSYRDGVRGAGFGLLSLVGTMGGIGGGVLATIMAGHQFWGIPGWRCAFMLMAILSVLIAFLVFIFVVDPRKTTSFSHGTGENFERDELVEKGHTNTSVSSVWMESWIATKAVIKVPTFQIIVLQGIVGSLPWTAMVFFTMWFELIGFDHSSTAALLSLFAIGCAIGSFFGGVVADRISQIYPHSGRIMCAQFSAFMGIPFSWFLLTLIPQSVSSYYIFAVTLILMGLTISWNATAANGPMFAEVVPAKHRTMIYAFDRAKKKKLCFFFFFFSMRSSLDLLNLISFDDFGALNRIPRVMRVHGVISEFENKTSDGTTTNMEPCERRIIVANQLPVKGCYDKESNKWCFEYDEDSLVLQLKDGFSPETEVIYVGSLNVEIAVDDQEEVSAILLEKFKCVPTFLPADVHKKFYHGFCKHYLWPLFHYMLPLTASHGARFDRGDWQAYLSANKIFADKVMEVINPDEDYVWIHDYHLMVLPSFLRKRFHRVKIGFFLHGTFPSSEIFTTLPVRDEILKSLLNSDLIGFHTFDYARHFLSCCSRMLGLNYESKRGYIGLDYFGRTVSIKILHAGIHMGQFESIMSLDVTGQRVKELKEKFDGKIVILGVDDMDLFKGIGLKFLAMGQLLEQHPDLRGKVVLVQITNPARSSGKDVQDLLSEINRIAEEINRKFGKLGYEPIVMIEGPLSTQDKVPYYAIAECCVVNCVRDGMNLVPYKYTVSRQGSPVLDRALGVDDNNPTPKKSVIIVSEFIGCSPSLSGAIRVNPWNVDSVADAMDSAIRMKDHEKVLRHEKHYKYISSHDVTYWARSFDQDLERACRDHLFKRCWGVGLGLGFRIVALGPEFRKLGTHHIASAYNKTNSRLILLDYDGTVMPQTSEDKRPSAEVLSILNNFCNDPKNVVFIVSGRGKDSLGNWFSDVEQLGLSAEHGYFTRWCKNSAWEISSLMKDFDWKEIAEPVMKLYTETTDGSFIEDKETAMVWHHQHADSHFGSSQAKELLDHLENVLANEPVVVKRGQHIVEVKPQGVSKGIVVKNLISTMRSTGKSPDFVLCIGDDRSDEDMFESIEQAVADPSLPGIAEVFACTVGQKPSMAKYYLDDTTEVINLLEGLATESVNSKSQESQELL